jgi:hypothetical protein
MVFWIVLIASGARKSYLYYSSPGMSFQEIMTSVRDYLLIFAVSGIFLTAGIMMIAFPLLKKWRQWAAA